MKLDMVADLEVDMVADNVADMEVDIVADMEVDKVVDMVADMLVYFDIKVILCVFFWSFSSKDTTTTYYHNDDHFHRYHNHCYLVRSNVIFDVRRKGEGDYKWYLLGPSNGVTAIIAPTQHYITPRDRGRITIS